MCRLIVVGSKYRRHVGLTLEMADKTRQRIRMYRHVSIKEHQYVASSNGRTLIPCDSRPAWSIRHSKTCHTCLPHDVCRIVYRPVIHDDDLEWCVRRCRERRKARTQIVGGLICRHDH